MAVALVSSPFRAQAAPLASRTQEFLDSINYLLRDKNWNAAISDEIKLRDGLLLCQRLREGHTEKELDDRFIQATTQMPESTLAVYRSYYAAVTIASTYNLCPEYKKQR